MRTIAYLLLTFITITLNAQQFLSFKKVGQSDFMHFDLLSSTITFNGSQATITTGQLQQSYPIEEIDYFAFQSPSVITSQIKADDPRVKVDGENLFFYNFTNSRSQAVSLYNMQGQLMRSLIHSLDEVLPLPDLSSGIYIIKVDQESFKFIKH